MAGKVHGGRSPLSPADWSPASWCLRVSSLSVWYAAAAALQPVALRRVAPAFAAVTLHWLHNNGERALLGHDFGVWAQGLHVAGAASSYDDFAGVEACPLPRPAPQSLADSGFLAASGPPRPAPHPADEWAFVESTPPRCLTRETTALLRWRRLTTSSSATSARTVLWMRMRARMAGSSQVMRCISARSLRRLSARVPLDCIREP